MGVGALLTSASWFRAEHFDPGRTSSPLAALQSKSPRGQHSAPSGFGGIPFLIKDAFVRTFLTGLALVMLMPLGTVLFVMALGQKSSDITEVVFQIRLLPYWIFISTFLQITPILRELRFLRTLPFSATSLATVMIITVILPIIALAPLVVGAAGLAAGTPSAIMALTGFTFVLAPASLSIFFAVWRGAGKQGYFLMYLTILGFQQVPLFFHYREIPFALAATTAAITILLAFLLTRRAIRLSSHAYRVQANPFGNVAWGAGR